MKFCIICIILLFTIYGCLAQKWEAEIMAGASGYNGDLTGKLIPLNTLQPAVNLNLKYNIGNIIVLRTGVAWMNVQGDDKYNRQADLKARNLNFKSTVVEGSLCAEFNLLEPDFFYAYPYLFASIGMFHFNPYTFDKDDKKTYLRPLGTEGQGIPGYPKPYSLIQLCLPVGGGWKLNLNEKYDIIYELGYRILFTDYLDDVSTTYVNSQTLLDGRGAKTVELAYRHQATPDNNRPRDGDIRGNSKVKDGYFFSGIKLLMHIKGSTRHKKSLY